MFLATRLTGFNVLPRLLQFVGGTSGDWVGSGVAALSLTSLTGGIASAPAAGDFVVVFSGAAGTTAHNLTMTTADYTEECDLYADDNDDAELAVYWKFMSSSPDTEVLVGGTDGITGQAVAVHVWRGVHPTSPLDVAIQTATGINSVLANPPSITPVTPGAVILAGACGGHGVGVQTFTHADLQNLVTRGADYTRDPTIAIGSIPWTGGAYNPAAFGFSTSDSVNHSWCAATLALRPA